MRRDPMADETATLVVEARDLDAVRARVDDLGGSVLEELRFADLRVRLPEPAVDAFCDLEGLERVETADVLGLGLSDDAPPE